MNISLRSFNQPSASTRILELFAPSPIFAPLTTFLLGKFILGRTLGETKRHTDPPDIFWNPMKSKRPQLKPTKTAWDWLQIKSWMAEWLFADKASTGSWFIFSLWSNANADRKSNILGSVVPIWVIQVPSGSTVSLQWNYKTFWTWQWVALLLQTTFFTRNTFMISKLQDVQPDPRW